MTCLRVRDCRNLSQQGRNTERGEISSAYSYRDLEVGLSKTCRLEEISFGWGFSYFSIKALKPAITSLRAIAVGLGASLGEDILIQLPSTCPILESIVLYFQVLLVKQRLIYLLLGEITLLETLFPCKCCCSFVFYLYPILHYFEVGHLISNISLVRLVMIGSLSWIFFEISYHILLCDWARYILSLSCL